MTVKEKAIMLITIVATNCASFIIGHNIGYHKALADALKIVKDALGH